MGRIALVFGLIAKAGDVTLTVWDQEVRGGQNKQMKQLNAEFMQKYPNVTIKRVAKSFTAAFRSLAQGEVKEYTELLEDSRRHAVDRMIENARLLGANAVVSMRFDSSEIGQQFTEIVAYGTAVVVEPRG